MKSEDNWHPKSCARRRMKKTAEETSGKGGGGSGKCTAAIESSKIFSAQWRKFKGSMSVTQSWDCDLEFSCCFMSFGITSMRGSFQHNSRIIDRKNTRDEKKYGSSSVKLPFSRIIQYNSQALTDSVLKFTGRGKSYVQYYACFPCLLSPAARLIFIHFHLHFSTLLLSQHIWSQPSVYSRDTAFFPASTWCVISNSSLNNPLCNFLFPHILFHRHFKCHLWIHHSLPSLFTDFLFKSPSICLPSFFFSVQIKWRQKGTCGTSVIAGYHLQNCFSRVQEHSTSNSLKQFDNTELPRTLASLTWEIRVSEPKRQWEHTPTTALPIPFFFSRKPY